MIDSLQLEKQLWSAYTKYFVYFFAVVEYSMIKYLLHYSADLLFKYIDINPTL